MKDRTPEQWARIQRRLYLKPWGCFGWAGCRDTAGFPTVGRPGGGNDKLHRVLFAREYPKLDIKGWCVIQVVCMDHGCLNVKHMKRMRKHDADRLGDPNKYLTKRLTWEIVRRLRANPPTNKTAEADRLGVGMSTVTRILNNKTWRENCTNQSTSNPGVNRLITKVKILTTTTSPSGVFSGVHPWSARTLSTSRST